MGFLDSGGEELVLVIVTEPCCCFLPHGAVMLLKESTSNKGKRRPGGHSNGTREGCIHGVRAHRCRLARGRVLGLVEQLVPSRVIVRRNGTPETYYLLTPGIAKRSSSRSSGHPGRASIRLVKARPGPAGSMARMTRSPHAGSCVVHDEGRIIGFDEGGQPAVFESATRDLSAAASGGGRTEAGQSLMAEFPEKVKLDETASLLVSLVRDFVPGASLAVTLPQGSEIDIVVQARRGFALEGPAEGKLVVTGEEEGLPLQFKLRSTAPGPGQVRVLAFHTGRPLGMITLAPVVVESAGDVGSASQTRDGTLAPATVRVPDLSLLILESKDQGRRCSALRLTSADPSLGYNLKPFGPIRLRSEPYGYFQSFFKDIETLPIQSVARQGQGRAAAGGQGGEPVRAARAGGPAGASSGSSVARITSVQVQSEEPWIPWELCKLVGKSADSDEIEDGPFLCEAFQLTRWIPGLAQIPQLGMKKLALVVPNDSRPTLRGLGARLRPLAGRGRRASSRSPRPSWTYWRPWPPGLRRLAFQRPRRRSQRAKARAVGDDPARGRQAHARRPERSGGQPGQAAPAGLPERLPDWPVGRWG